MKGGTARAVAGESASSAESFGNSRLSKSTMKQVEGGHGNSINSKNLQHGYEITNETKGIRHKVGVSGTKLNENGTSKRANSQVNRLNKQGGDVFKAEVKVKNVEGRNKILNWEQSEVDSHFKKTGVTPDGQKRPKPSGT